MLVELHIENFAIIDQLSLQLGPGLVIFTGETGAGKSILIDAVQTLLGERADATMVRSNTDHAIVEGVFSIPQTLREDIHSILDREELLDDPDTLILGREIRLNGRNLARINGHVVSLALLREIGERLVDVHGQSEHLSLLHVNHHLELLDRYAELDGMAKIYRKTYQRLLALRRELAELRQSERDAARQMDMLSYQIHEIEAAHLRQDEDDELKDERNRLANAEELASLTQGALLALDEGTPESPAATDLIGQVAQAFNSLARLDPSVSELHEQIQGISDSLSDLSRALNSYLEGIEFNPRRLDQVEERLGLIHNLKRKYGDTIPAILEFAKKSRRQLETITHAGERIQELEKEEEELLLRLGKEGYALSQKRHQQAAKLGRGVEAELADLQMSHTRFEVDFQQQLDPNGVFLDDGRRVAFDAHGLEKIEFLIAPNPGEGLKPLTKIASGGETSRLMLALKHILASADQVPTLIFDEIDQGIGGRVGTVVGHKLWGLARQHQVLCVTHLPQLAAFGEIHFHVEKQVHEQRTTTQVRRLDGESRPLELAQMYGGVSQGTIQSAKELLLEVRKTTQIKPD
jgi:DNA repair protein RecN (Recombination protein N)